MKTDIQTENNGEHNLQLLCTHADNLALGNTDQPQKRTSATTIRSREIVGPATTIRSREVVGPPLEEVARPTLTPRDQTLNYNKNGLPTSFSRASSLISLKLCSLRLERREAKARERGGWCRGSPAGCLRGMCAAVLPFALVECCVPRS